MDEIILTVSYEEREEIKEAAERSGYGGNLSDFILAVLHDHLAGVII